MEKRRNVYEAALSRIEKIFTDFDNVYVSFSGGKDSGVLLNLCIDYVRRHRLNRRIGVFHMDYEVQYSETLKYVEEVLAQNTDILDIYRVCVPFKVQTCTSMHQSYWRPWDDEMKELWVREMPRSAYRKEDFDFFSDDLWDYDFQIKFAEWLHRYFTEDKATGQYTVVPAIKNNVIFRSFNLMDPIQFRLKFDVIFCRNVMIYFNAETRDALVKRFYDAMLPSSYLFISHSESLGQTPLFRMVAPAVYQKK